jgi:hypothetical protein
MPERSFKIEIRNATSDLALVQSFNHLCGGSWTAGLAPQGRIPPSSSAALEAESDGIMTGTEGYVKYDLIRGPGKFGMIYAYWDNPWWGVTHFRCGGALDDIFPDCDFDPPAGSSGFTGGPLTAASLHFVSYIGGKAGGGEITSLTDFSNAALLGPFFTFALLGIDKNPTLRLEVVDSTTVSSPGTSVPLFGSAPPGRRSLRLFTKAPLEQWVGLWSQGRVEIRIDRVNSLLLSARITDRSTATPLEFTDSFTPGPEGLLQSGASPILDGLIGHNIQAVQERQTVRRVATRIIQSAAARPLSRSLVRQRVQAEVGQNSGITTTDLEKFSGALGKILSPASGAAYLSHNVALHLYAVLQGGVQIGFQLQYQRLGASGEVLANAFLDLGGALR